MFNWGSRSKPATKASGEAAEDAALAHMQRAGPRLLERNYRVAAGPSRRAGEVDLIMSDRDGTLVFVEVRARIDASHGGAAAGVTPQSSSASSTPPSTTCCATPARRPAVSTWWPSTAPT